MRIGSQEVQNSQAKIRELFLALLISWRPVHFIAFFTGQRLHLVLEEFCPHIRPLRSRMISYLAVGK